MRKMAFINTFSDTRNLEGVGYGKGFRWNYGIIVGLPPSIHTNKMELMFEDEAERLQDFILRYKEARRSQSKYVHHDHQTIQDWFTRHGLEVFGYRAFLDLLSERYKKPKVVIEGEDANIQEKVVKGAIESFLITKFNTEREKHKIYFIRGERGLPSSSDHCRKFALASLEEIKSRDEFHGGCGPDIIRYWRVRIPRLEETCREAKRMLYPDIYK